MAGPQSHFPESMILILNRCCLAVVWQNLNLLIVVISSLWNLRSLNHGSLFILGFKEWKRLPNRLPFVLPIRYSIFKWNRKVVGMIKFRTCYVVIIFFFRILFNFFKFSLHYLNFIHNYSYFSTCSLFKFLIHLHCFSVSLLDDFSVYFIYNFLQ